MPSQGATTSWEQWNGRWSQIHACLPNPGGWSYQGLAGIRPDEAGPGFKKIIIKPAAKVDGVKFVRMGNGAATHEIGSGTCRFQSTLPETAT